MCRAGAGRAPALFRRAAFGNSGLDEPLRGLIRRVATEPTRVTDSQFEATRSAGLTEDRLFEAVIGAAFGEAFRQYRTALAELDATAESRASTQTRRVSYRALPIGHSAPML